MTESGIWSKLKVAISIYDRNADATRHEDRMTAGIPDVSFGIMGIGGWTELKAYAAWPADLTALVPFRNLKPEQRLWIRKRSRAGIPVTILAAFGSEYILLPASCVMLLGELTRRELYQKALWRGTRLDSQCISHMIEPYKFKQSDPRCQV